MKPEKSLLAKRSQNKHLARAFKCAGLIAIPERISVDRWTEGVRGMPLDDYPWQRQILADLTNRKIIRHVLQMAAQEAGKTEIGNNLVGYHIDHEPSTIQVLLPDLDAAESWVKEKLNTMLRKARCFEGKIADGTKREAGNTIRHKVFPGGFVAASGSNAPAGLSRRSARVLWADEPDRYAPSAGREGDPLTLLWNRGASFDDVIQLVTGTPTIKGNSRIESEFDASDKNYWHVRCPKCGHEQNLIWERIDFGAHKRGGTFERPLYTCGNGDCDAAWTDEERCEAVRKGRWIATAEFRGIRGYHLNGIYSLRDPQRGYTTRMGEMVAKFLEAKKLGPLSLKVWENTFLALTWDESNDFENIDPAPLLNGREDYTVQALPKEVLMLTLGGDVQGDRIEVEVVGHGLGEETWGIEFKIFQGNPQSPKTWEQVRQFLNTRYTHPEYGPLIISAAAIDSGHCAKTVYQFCKQFWPRSIYPVKGSSIMNGPPVALSKRKGLLMIGTDTIKELIYSRLKTEEHGPGFMHYPKECGYDDEYFNQLTSERIEHVFENGKKKRKWVCPSHKRNEALDIRVYATAAFLMLNPQLEKLANNLAKRKKIEEVGTNEQPPGGQSPISRVPSPPSRRWMPRSRSGGWL
jgi:phage terminase large subunit GpA-like protein